MFLSRTFKCHYRKSEVTFEDVGLQVNQCTAFNNQFENAVILIINKVRFGTVSRRGFIMPTYEVSLDQIRINNRY